MSQLDRAGLISQSNFLFPDNTTAEITPQDVRQFDLDVIDSFALTGSLVVSASYAVTATSASHALISDNAIEIFVSAKNTSGFDIPKGTAVHSSGVTGDKININTASYDDPTLMPAIGITQELIANNAVGDVILTGRIQGINTSNLTEGATVYVNGDGSLTSTKPTGSALIQNIGTCVKSNATEGEVLVLGSGRTNDLPNIQNGYAWVGDVNGVPTAIPTSSFAGSVPVGVATTGSNDFFGDQTITSTSSAALTITSGVGDASPITIEGGSNPAEGKFTNSSIKGVVDLEATNLISTALTTSSLHIGEDESISNTVSIINKFNTGNDNIGLGFSTSNTLNAYTPFDVTKAGITNIKGTTINLLGSGSTTSVDIDGDVTASNFTGSFIGDGTGLTLDSNIAYTNVSNTFTQAQTIQGLTTINDTTTDADNKTFTIQKQGADIFTLYNSSSANNNEGQVDIKGGVNIISSAGQNKLSITDAGNNNATMGTDSVGIKGSSDSIAFTQLTAGGVWGRSLDTDDNNTALWISGTPTKITNYGYTLSSDYTDTVGVFVATGPQFGGTPANPLFYQYISSSTEYQGGDSSIHFGQTLTADNGIQTPVGITATPLDIIASGSRKLRINRQGLVDLGLAWDIESNNNWSHNGNLYLTGALDVATGNPVSATQFEAFEAVITPRLESSTGTVTVESELVISGSVNVQEGNPVEATQFQARESVITPLLESSTGTIIAESNVNVTGSVDVSNQVSATQLEAREALITATIESGTGTTTIANSTVISGSLTLQSGNPIEATQVQANESVITPAVQSGTGTLTLESNTVISGSLTLEPNRPIEATQVQANESVITPLIQSGTGTLTAESNFVVSGSIDVVAGQPVVATQFEARESVVTPILESGTGTVEIGSTMKLVQQDPLPTGGVGQLAVSASNLYYHNGTSWAQIN